MQPASPEAEHRVEFSQLGDACFQFGQGHCERLCELFDFPFLAWEKLVKWGVEQPNGDGRAVHNRE